jgi:hypothetical protein
VLDYDPISNLQHWPCPMARFGVNPHGQPLYRIVFAPSRRYLNISDWDKDGNKYAKWVPLYRRLGNVWVMEKWRTPEEFEPRGKAAWPLLLGPWPDKGEYELCHVFEACLPSDANIEKLIAWVEMGNKHTLYEKIVHARAETEREQDQMRNTVRDRIRNKLPAFGYRVISGSHGSRGSKTGKILKSAEELGLPTTPGMRTKPNPRRRKAA